MILNDYISLSAGVNTTRNPVSEDILYSLEDLERDLMGCAGNKAPEADESLPTVSEGDFVVSLIRNKASVVSENNAGKVISTNYIKATLDENVVDPWYLCYCINEDEDVKKQIMYEGQSTTTNMARLSMATVKKLEIAFPDIEVQRLIGSTYKEVMHLSYLNREKEKQLRSSIGAVLKNFKTKE